MTTTSNSCVSDCWITDVLAGVGLNVLEQDKERTLDTVHNGRTENNTDSNLLCLSEDVNGCDKIEEGSKTDCVSVSNKRVEMSGIEGNRGEKEPPNSSKRILKINENNAEFCQPVQKKLRLSNMTPNEETGMDGRSKLHYSRQITRFPPDVHHVTSSEAPVSSRKQRSDVGLPCSLQGMNPKQVFIEKHFGLRIKNPLVTLSMLDEKMSGKCAVHMDRIKTYTQKGDLENKDWVIAGVIVKKHATTSQAGKQYCSWTLSDLRENLLTVTVLLFSYAFKELWKSSVGTVVGILNPLVMESRSQHDGVATFSVRNSDQVMLWGQSSDFGICEARKKNGENCTMFVNKRLCSCCIYHAQKEYKKYCGRSELQKATGGNLRQMISKKSAWNTPTENKNSGFTERVVACRNKNLIQKDMNLLASLGNDTAPFKCGSKDKKNATQINHTSEIKAKTKLQEILLLSKSASTVIPDTPQTSCRNSEVNKNGMVTAKKVIDSLKPTFVTAKYGNETCKGTVINKKKRFEKLSLSIVVDNTDQKNQNVDKSFDSKALIDKIMSTKTEKNAYVFDEKDFSLLIDKKNSGTSKCYSKNNSYKLEKSVENLSVGQQNRMVESVVTKINTNVECNAPKLNNPNSDTDIKPGLVSLASRDKAGQTKIRTCVTESINRNVEHKIPTLSDPNSNTSAKFDLQKVVKDPSENMNNGKTKQSTDKTIIKKKEFTKDMCNQLAVETQSEMFAVKHQNLLSMKVPDTRSSYGNRSKSMMEAIRYVREHGPIQKNRKSSQMKQMKCESYKECTSKDVQENQGTAVISDRFKVLMNAESTHTQLAESTAMEEYYYKIEQKEKIEDKLLNTYKIECKIVICKVCKYKAGSASEFCKQNNHPLVCVKGYRRFFKCSNCSKRTVVYDVFPHYNCVHCGSSSWIRVPVLEVKTTVANLNQLSIRGDEQKFINSHEASGNINLLVPEC